MGLVLLFLYKLVHVLEIPIFFSCFFIVCGLRANNLSFLSPSCPAPPDSSPLLALHGACQRHSMPHTPCLWDESCYPRVFWEETETPRRCLGGKSTHLKDTKDLGETTGCSGTILSPLQEAFFCQHTIFCL